MKITAARVEPFLKAPPPAIRAVLVYGPDQGLVRERVRRLVCAIVADPTDPFRVAEIRPAALRDEPSRLADEAAAIALGGGRRVVVLRDAADAQSAAVAACLDLPLGDTLVVVESGELGPRSSLRKLFEGAETAAALPCYGDEGGTLAAVIQDELKAAGLMAEPDAMAFLTEHLGGDRSQTRAEMAKLALYMGGPGRVRLDDAQESIGDSAALGLDDLVFATGDGDHAGAQRVVDRLLSEGVAPVAMLRAVARHFVRLHLVVGEVAQGRSLDQVIGAMKPPLNFRVADRFRRQAGRWPLDRLGRALDLLTEAELGCKTTGLPGPELAARAVMMIARAASRR